MKLCSRLLSLVEISAKNDKFGQLNPILGKLGVTHGLGWWLAGKPMVNFLFALIERFSLSITVPELEGEMCTALLFSQWVDLFALKFYLDTSSPSTILGVSKLESLGYSTVKTTPICVPSFWHDTGVWRTDRRNIYSAFKASFAVTCGAL